MMINFMSRKSYFTIDRLQALAPGAIDERQNRPSGINQIES